MILSDRMFMVSHAIKGLGLMQFRVSQAVEGLGFRSRRIVIIIRSES